MPELLRIPEVAAGTTEAVLTSWPLAENTPYAKGDVLATVETAKAVADIEAEASGVILRRLVPEGAEVSGGEPIALIGALGESVENIDAALDSAPAPQPTRPPEPGRRRPSHRCNRRPRRRPRAGRR